MTRSKGPVPDINTDPPEPRKSRKTTGQTTTVGHKRKASISNGEVESKGVKKVSRANGKSDSGKIATDDLIGKADTDNLPHTESASVKKKKKSGKTKATSKSTATKQSSAKPQAAAIDEDGQETTSTLNYWLMKAEPESRIENGVDVKFSIDDLAAKNEPEAWDGVRNYVARNNMRAMRKGELAFFYHSNCKTPGIAGVMEIVREHSPDESAFDQSHPYFDPKSDREDPKWSVVHVEFRAKFDEFVPLEKLQEYKNVGDPLGGLQLLKQSRLSVSKVSVEEWKFICGLANVDPVIMDRTD